MLTKESYQLIDSFLGDCDVESLLRDPNLKELFNKLQKQTYTNSRIKITHGVKLFPQSYFLDKSLALKLYNEKDVLSISWKTTNSEDKTVTCLLHIYLENKDNPLPNTKLLVKSLSFLFSLTNKDRKITIHLACLDDKKIIRKNQKNLTKRNINSGSCKFTDTESEILVWRKEEVIKVLFHECIHALRISNLNTDEKITERLCQKYHLSSKNILIDESYTEAWAKILNCFFVSQIVNAKNIYQHFCTMLALEKEFTIYQGNKIKLIIKKSRTNKKKVPIDSETNVTAYFIVVGELFSHLDEFLRLCGTSPYLLNNKSFKQYLLKLNQIDKKQVKLTDKHYNTMKMSVIELKI